MRYIVFLRAVNVGGKKKINMAELRNVLESMGLSQVQTYIQSGNILFDSDETEESLQTALETSVEDHFGFPVELVLRTSTELAQIVENCPFSEHVESGAPSSGPATLYVALLDAPLPEDNIQRLDRYTSDYENYQSVGRNIYLLLEQGMGHSKLAPQVQTLGARATIRNWKTLTKLRAMADNAV